VPDIVARLKHSAASILAGTLTLLPVAAWAAAADPQPLIYPDADTEKACSAPGESPECAAKTFVACSEKSVAVCKLAGLNVQSDGIQHKSDDGSLAGDVWLKPWTLTWTELLGITHPTHTVWQIEGVREVSAQRLRGVPSSRRGLAGALEMMITTMDAAGKEEKQSIFMAQKKGAWSTTGFAKWRDDQNVSACEKRKLGSLACRYTVPSIAAWDLTPQQPKP
jgi:hypothetical protein